MTTLKNVIDIAISIVVRYKVLGFEESGVRILLYLMRLVNAINYFKSKN